MPQVPLEWISDPRIFVALERPWSALRESDPDATPFHTPEYLKLYWEELGAGRLSVALIGGRDRPAGICPFEIHEGLLSFLGGYEVTDYMGPVGLTDERGRVAKELMEGLAARDDWARADLEGLAEDGTWLSALAEAAADAGLRPEVEDDDVAPMLHLPPTWEAYLASLRAKQRHEVRRKARRLRDAFPDARLARSTPDTLGPDLEWFAEMHRSAAGKKGRFMRPGMELFFRRLGEELLPRGVLRLLFLEADGSKLAGMIAFELEGTVSLYNSAYDPRHRAVAPGMVLIAELIADAIARGCRRLDMLKGDLGYKYRFGARPRAIKRLLLERP